MKNAANVHRFHDFVACSVGDGSTAYLSPKAARELARALNRAARSIKAESFVNSTVGSIEIKDGADWHTSRRGA